MINASDAYRAAVCADTRRTVVRVETDVTDPDAVYVDTTGSAQAAISVPEQVYGNHDSLDRYATLERNYWLLDGSMNMFDDDYERQDITDKIGWVSEDICGDGGTFAAPLTVAVSFDYAGLLQIATIIFPDDPNDGVPADFTAAVVAGDITVAQWSATGNRATETQESGFEAYHPDRIVLTITRWSVPGRRARLRQVIPGYHLVWSGDDIASLTVEQNTDPSCASLPYGTAKLSIDNSGRTFEPRNKEGFFRSIQARQMVEIWIGLYVGDQIDYKRIGRFYQHSGGWSTSDNGLSIDWDLVDIIGLLTDREYILPKETPKTLAEYAASVVAHLGRNFSDRYHVDPDYRDAAVAVPKRKALQGQKLGDIVRYLALATGTWPRADAETGALTFEPLWDQGVRMSLHNMNTYPTMYENEDVGTITVTKPEIIDRESGEVIEEEKNIFGGTNIAASRTISIESPFIIDDADVNRIFRQVVTQCGGNAYDVTWRGDPTAEAGDVVTLELDERHATSARMVEQSFDYSAGVLAKCRAKLIQPTGYWTYANGTVITEDSVFVVPAGVTVLYIILVGGGRAGENGDDGSFTQDGLDGFDGAGGTIYADGMNVYAGQRFQVVIGAGSDSYYKDPEPTLFGDLSSDQGKKYYPSYTDIRSGSAFGRFGVKNPLPNTGDGGKGGKGGRQGKMHLGKEKDDYGFVTEIEIVDEYPTPGERGSPGSSGCVVVYWN